MRKLLEVLHKLTDLGNTVLIIEHNLDVIRNADWILDLGPEGGEGGGHILAEGTPAQISQVAASHTGSFLKRHYADFLQSEAAHPEPLAEAKIAKPVRAGTRKRRAPVQCARFPPHRQSCCRQVDRSRYTKRSHSRASTRSGLTSATFFFCCSCRR